ncbi:MAG TPA: sodium:solute symporter family protein [Bacteroidetes bacterium]|nr:sodium:solute symporter family protein [Bacteroidota bacterium]
MNAALIIIFLMIVFSSAVGVYAGKRLKMNLEEWAVGGRKFGVILIWLLMAGEIYTTFTFLGASGWAYSKGGPVFYILIYGTLAYIFSYFLLPPLWRMGKKYGFQTQPDFFIKRYDSRALGVFVALVGFFSIVPYLQLQLAGLGFIVRVASHETIHENTAILIAFLLTTAFVFTSGIRGAAWVAVIKDLMMIGVVGFVGLGVPIIYFGSYSNLFTQLIEKAPQHLTFPGATTSMGVSWVMSTALMKGFGFYMWPHAMGSAFSAKSDSVIKRNAIIMPFYQLPLLMVFLVGFTAFLVLPHLENGDMAFLELVKRTYPDWFLGVVGAAGALTAMVPSAILILFASTMIAKNVYQTGFNPGAREGTVMRLSRAMVLIIAALALFFAIVVPNEIVRLLIVGYYGVTQFFPGVVFGLFWKRVTKTGIWAGLLAGVAIVLVLLITGNDPLWGLNAGIIALTANLFLAVSVSLLTSQKNPNASWEG